MLVTVKLYLLGFLKNLFTSVVFAKWPTAIVKFFSGSVMNSVPIIKVYTPEKKRNEYKRMYIKKRMYITHICEHDEVWIYAALIENQ